MILSCANPLAVTLFIDFLFHLVKKILGGAPPFFPACRAQHGRPGKKGEPPLIFFKPNGNDKIHGAFAHFCPSLGLARLLVSGIRRLGIGKLGVF